MAGETRYNYPDCKPKIDSTNTEAVWKERIDEGGWFVQLDPATTTADEMGIDFMANNAAFTLGRAIGYTGTGDSFRVTVEPCRARGYAVGGATGAFTAATHFGKYMKANTDGKLVVDTTLTAGNIVLLGGDQAEPLVTWQYPHG